MTRNVIQGFFTTARAGKDIHKRQMKRIVHVEVLLAVQHLGNGVQHFICARRALTPFPRRGAAMIEGICQTSRGQLQINAVKVVNGVVLEQGV